MEAEVLVTLPYRADGDGLFRLIEQRGRGRELDKIQALGFPKRSFPGLVLTARQLGLMSSEDDSLLEAGKRVALASTDEDRAQVLFEQIMAYEPYSMLLENVFAKGNPESTDLQHFETWWAQYEYGTSLTNRSEAAITFAALLTATGLGQFIVGRKGRSSRIDWSDSAAERIREHTWSHNADIRDPGSEQKDREAASEEGRREAGQSSHVGPSPSDQAVADTGATGQNVGQVMRFPLSRTCVATVSFSDEVTPRDLERLVRYLELSSEMLSDDGSSTDETAPSG